MPAEDVPPSVQQVEPKASSETSEGLLELILSEQETVSAPRRIDGVVIGTLAGIAQSGQPMVTFPQNASGAAVAARSMVAVGAADIGKEVALLFEGGDQQCPVLMGLMFKPDPMPLLPSPAVEKDGERLVFEAQREIVFRCGESSITLTRAGKVLIKGAYVLTRSAGVNRIQGGSVEIN